jgi:hypothetical protein
MPAMRSFKSGQTPVRNPTFLAVDAGETPGFEIGKIPVRPIPADKKESQANHPPCISNSGVCRISRPPYQNGHSRQSCRMCAQFLSTARICVQIEPWAKHVNVANIYGITGPPQSYKTRHPQNDQINKQIQDSDAVRIRNIYTHEYMLAVRSGTMLVSLLKAPSAVATVGYLAVGLTLPFFAAYKEKYRPFLLN